MLFNIKIMKLQEYLLISSFI